jgi:hypothetical protein
MSRFSTDSLNARDHLGDPHALCQKARGKGHLCSAKISLPSSRRLLFKPVFVMQAAQDGPCYDA